MANPNVQNHGGPVIGKVEVVPIIWGNQWPYDGSTNFPAQLFAFLQFYVGPDSTMMAMLREYSTPTTQITPGSVLGTAPIRIQVNPQPIMTDAQVQSALHSWIANANGQTPNFPQPNTNRVFVICLPYGVAVASGRQVTCINMGGYHSLIGDAVYILLPCCTPPNAPASAALNGLTIRLSHEICETITDPGPKGWTDTNGSGEEIGDICAVHGQYPQFASSPVGTVGTPSGGAFRVQPIWSQAQLNCVFGTTIKLTGLQLPTSVTGGHPAPGAVIINIPVPTLPAGGILINLSTDLPGVLKFISPAAILPGNIKAGIHGTTTPVPVPTSVTVRAALGAQFIEQVVWVMPPKIAEFKYTPGSAPGFQTPPNAPEGVLLLDQPALAGGVTINISSSEPQIATPEPDVISIPAGAVSPTEKFYLQVTPVGVQTPVVLTASMTGSSALFTFQVLPGGPPIIIVTRLTIHPQSVIGGQIAFAEFTLASAVGPAGGSITVTSSDTSVATVPTTVPVAPNATGGRFEISTKPLQQGTQHKFCTINAFENGPNLAFALLTVTS